MAARLSLDERVFIESSLGASRSVADVARRLGRDPSTVHRELARWADVEAALGIEVFFCEPRSPWQRPTNEHTNALLRRWLPKGTSLDIGQLRLAVIEDKLNHMPRRLHHWQSAAHTYHTTQSQPPVELAPSLSAPDRLPNSSATSSSIEGSSSLSRSEIDLLMPRP